MNPFVRWLRFNLVGALGMVLQLAALALFNRCTPGHYLFTSAAALEVTLLHNFVWHVRYTWRDRHGESALLIPFVRFHFTNGLVSLLGNLALMHILIHEAHLPLLASNGIAILCCSVVNFVLGDFWAFAEMPQCTSRQAAKKRCKKRKSSCGREKRGRLVEIIFWSAVANLFPLLPDKKRAPHWG